MSNIIDKIQVSGVTYNLPSGGGSGSSTVELTQAEYDALVSGGTVDPDTYYIITDATPQDMSQYWTSAQTSSAITEAVSGKQDTLIAGTNIKTINNESILGSGNIDIQGGGGTTYSAGTNIEITSADTINCTLPISAFSSNSVVVVGKNNTAETQSNNDYIIGNYSKIDGKSILSSSYGDNKIFGTLNQIHKGNKNLCVGNSNSIGIDGYEASQNNCVVGSNNTISPFIGNTTSTNNNYVYGYNNKIDKKSYNYVVGSSNTVSGGNSCNILGSDNIPMNDNEVILGRYNNSVSDGTTSGNTLFSVGNGTSSSDRHNAFEIRQNGDIYITSGETDIKLQDNLGGGGSITIDPSLDSGSTNAVANSAITEAVTVDNIYIINYDGETIPTISNSDKITKIYVSMNNGSSNYHFSGKMGNNSAYSSTQLTPGDENQYAKAYVLDMYLPNYAYTYVLEAKPNNWLWNINFSADASLIKNVKTFKGGEGGIVSDVLPNVVDALSTDIFNTKLAIPTVTSSVSSASTDSEVPSAKAVYDTIGNINTILESI